MEVNAFLESDDDSDQDSSNEQNVNEHFNWYNIENDKEGNDQEHISHDSNKINFIRIPWEGAPPKIIIAKSQQNVLKSPFDHDVEDADNDEMRCVRKIWFCRDIRDSKGRVLKVWDLPLNWDVNDIRTVFNIFGDIVSVTLRDVNNIISRHCSIRFKHSSKVDFAMNYDSSSIIQPLLKGSKKLGIDKYLINYIRSRPHNVPQLKYEVDKFMSQWDKLQQQKRERARNKPRRLRGWIQRRGPDGFTTIHYPNKQERRKHRAVRIGGDTNSINIKLNKQENNDKDNDNVDGYGRPIGVGKINPINPNDTFNAKPEKAVYDTSRKEYYYRQNQIKDVFKKKERKLFIKRNKAKRKIKQQISKQYVDDKKKRVSWAASRLQESIRQKQRFQKDMNSTTNQRKNRNFKPN